MPSEHGFGDDGRKTTRSDKPDDRDDQMNENDEDVAHPAAYQSPKKPQNSGDFVIRHGQPFHYRIMEGCNNPDAIPSSNGRVRVECSRGEIDVPTH